MQYFKVALPLALASTALANPLAARGDNSCLAAVTGKACLGDDKLRADDCKSFLATTVTPSAVTVTSTVGSTITATPGWEKWKRVEQRGQVTVCPNQVPRYASACSNGPAYSSACSAFGYKDSFTTTLKAVTTTVTVTPASSCPAAPTQSACLTDAKAKFFVDSFVNFLEHTNYNGTQAPPGSGFNTSLAIQVLAPTFTDISDSINLLAQKPMGTVTFPSRDAFIGGQGSQPEVKVNVTNIYHNCKSVTFRYSVNTGSPVGLPVVGINVMELTSDLSQVQNQYAEFNSGAWLADLGNPECKKTTK